jgi:hypothetical protein
MRRRFSRSRFFAALTFCGVLAIGASGCKKDEPKSTRWDDAGAAATSAATGAAASAAAASTVATIPAGTFNKFFPKEGESGKRVFAADKPGFAEAKLQEDGKEVAVLSISDAEKQAFAKTKFEESTEKLDGYPVVKEGNNQTGVLVKGRFQVKVSSQTLDHDARKAILSTFDLKGLEAL